MHVAAGMSSELGDPLHAAQHGTGPAHFTLLTAVGPISPCTESSDDSYVSAGEDPLEAPIFEIPIQDMAVVVGAEVLLKCIVTANPQPEGEPPWASGARAWQRDSPHVHVPPALCEWDAQS